MGADECVCLVRTACGSGRVAIEPHYIFNEGVKVEPAPSVLSPQAATRLLPQAVLTRQDGLTFNPTTDLRSLH